MTANRQFIVTNECGMVLELYDGFDDSPRGGVLGNGNVGTLFSNRRTANSACARSLAYADKFNLPWEVEKWKVQVVK